MTIAVAVLPAPRGGEGGMKLKREEQRVLGDALMALSGGDVRLFMDMMWIGFGDRWTPIVDALAAHGYVSSPDQDAYDSVRITERGTGLAQRLMGRLARSA
jgi:hypothetical protein